MKSTEKLTNVHVDLPNDPVGSGESMWAVDLGNDLYELRSVPFRAYDLNLGDIVRATRDAPGFKPEIRCVERRSGHQTLRVYFQESVPERKMRELLGSLRFLSVSFERGTKWIYALDLKPDSDLDRVRDVLDGWERKGWSMYETCEARVTGRFHDAPADP